MVSRVWSYCALCARLAARRGLCDCGRPFDFVGRFPRAVGEDVAARAFARRGFWVKNGNASAFRLMKKSPMGNGGA